MPWKETCVMDERVKFMSDWLSGDYRKGGLCAAYGISRPTGDKWIERYAEQGVEGLCEQSREPYHHPNQVSWEVQERIVEAKLAHQHWGPKKVMDWLRPKYPEVAWPVDSTAGEILKRAGLVRARKRRRHVAPYTEPFARISGPNTSWSADFKGDFVLGNGRRCYPLTVTDNYSRYLLQCRGLHRTHGPAVWPWFEWTFRTYGLPEAIRTDNGPPFASLAVGGVTALSKWWIQLGIRPERIEPGKPSQNGRHERMHRSLEEGIHPICDDLRTEQRQLDAYVDEFNWERSHEGIGRKTPASQYTPSPRSLPCKVAPVEYASEYAVRKVRHNGEIKWKGRLLYVTEVLAKEPVGLKEIDNDRWEVRYSFHLLGMLDEAKQTITPGTRWQGNPS